MRILFLTHAFNSLTQRLFVELTELGHEVSVEFDINEAVALEAVALFRPELIIAPFLKRAIPESIWRRHVCLVIHPGIRGDRGPSALDWAILKGERRWGVTVLQATGEMDAGDIWAYSAFDMRPATKASLYRNEVTGAAVEAALLAVERFASGGYEPVPQDYADAAVRGRAQPLVRQSDRAIDWHADDTAAVLRKIRSADGFPGVRDSLSGRQLYLFDAHEEKTLRGSPGDLIARRGSAVCRATRDGAVWIGHMRDQNGPNPFKLPAAMVLGEVAAELPEAPSPDGSDDDGIRYEERGAVGYLHFDFYNGAMGTEQCGRLREALRRARRRPTRVIVLAGGPDYWSNGMHLNLIEAADSPADESWRNINAIDDLALEIINCVSHLTVAALRGSCGAGGVFLARAADLVWARDGVILNPHYKDMGNLYGSEYWTYLLPRCAGPENAERVIQARLPVGTTEAASLGLIDEVLSHDPEEFMAAVESRADDLALAADLDRKLKRKKESRLADESDKPLAEYRSAELERMRLNFYGFDPSYHIARYNFVHKVPKSRTPLTIARHRRLSGRVRKAS